MNKYLKNEHANCIDSKKWMTKMNAIITVTSWGIVTTTRAKNQES